MAEELQSSIEKLTKDLEEFSTNFQKIVSKTITPIKEEAEKLSKTEEYQKINAEIQTLLNHALTYFGSGSIGATGATGSSNVENEILTGIESKLETEVNSELSGAKSGFIHNLEEKIETKIENQKETTPEDKFKKALELSGLALGLFLSSFADKSKTTKKRIY